MPLYPVYALLFADSGLSPAQVSSLFVIWSVTAVVFEVPSGVWADVFSRRWLLTLGPLLTAAGFALWTLFPSYPVFAAGFVLWGLGSSLRSGTWEALVYEELRRLGAKASYARLVGRAEAMGTTAVLVATAVAAPVMGAGGYAALGAASVAACLLCSAVSWTLPESRGTRPRTSSAPSPSPSPVADGPGGDARTEAQPEPEPETEVEEEEEEPSLRRVVSEGWEQVRRAPGVRGALALSVVLMGVTALDEYVPYLAASTGVAAAAVPLLVLMVSAGDAAGGWMAGRGLRWLMPAPAVAGICMVAGALAAAAGRAEGLLLVGAAFGVLQWAMAAADARLQERISDRSRATVTSLAGWGSEVLSVAIFAGYGAGSLWAGHGALFAVAGVPYVVMTAVLYCSARRRRRGRGRDRGRGEVA
ncbi:MFS transporter [Actinomadura sp. 21ATH]|uniref:MFS transporter n=1 Tax=Actinomadura sp. 21ATH TaxID=1735444 RepID=UPI0035BFE01C